MQLLYNFARIGEIIGALNFRYFLGIPSGPMLLSGFIGLMRIKFLFHTPVLEKQFFSEISA